MKLKWGGAVTKWDSYFHGLQNLISTSILDIQFSQHPDYQPQYQSRQSPGYVFLTSSSMNQRSFTLRRTHLRGFKLRYALKLSSSSFSDHLRSVSVPIYLPFPSRAKCFRYSLLGMKTHFGSEPENLVPFSLLARRLNRNPCRSCLSSNTSQFFQVMSLTCTNDYVGLNSHFCLLIFIALLRIHHHSDDAIVGKSKWW